MDESGIRIMNVADARRALTNGDRLSDIAFQTDVNRLLARLDDILPSTARPPRPRAAVTAPGSALPSAEWHRGEPLGAVPSVEILD
jgi:hypothetical protein